MFTFKKLCTEVLIDEETTMYWLQRRNVLSNARLLAVLLTGRDRLRGDAHVRDARPFFR